MLNLSLEFTVGSCSSDPGDVIRTVQLPNIPDKFQVCEELCLNFSDCMFWSLLCNELSICTCSNLHYSYLHSCNIVGANEDTELAVRC